jgi:hypothetical protein
VVTYEHGAPEELASDADGAFAAQRRLGDGETAEIVVFDRWGNHSRPAAITG